jgi:hypothetical protein
MNFKLLHHSINPFYVASNVQRLFRGYLSRKKAEKEREEELIFIGMKAGVNNRSKELEKELDLARVKRKNIQMAHIEQYKSSLEELKDTVLEEEGPDMREIFMGERTKWVTEQLSNGKGIPDAEEMEKFFDDRDNPPPPEDDEAKEEEGGGKKGKDKKGGKDKKDKKDGKKDKKGGKGIMI